MEMETEEMAINARKTIVKDTELSPVHGSR